MEDNKALIQISEAQMALDRTNNIYEMRTIGNLASAAAIFAERQGLIEIAQTAKILELKSNRKAGNWLSNNVRAGNPNCNNLVTIEKLPDGISRMESSRLQLQASKAMAIELIYKVLRRKDG